jgi:hypothetical protein
VRFLTPALLSAAILLSGCTGKTAPSPQYAPVATAQSAPVAPTPMAQPQPTVPTLPLPKLSASQISRMEVWAPRPENPHIVLNLKDDSSLIDALAKAITDAGAGQIREQSSPARLFTSVQLRSGENLTLTLPEEGGPAEAMWQGQPLLIDSPALSRALEALEPVLARAEKPGLHIWAVDLTGARAPERLLDLPEPLVLTGMSPDGQHLLLVEQLGEYKGDYTAIPFLLDRTTGALREGAKTSIRTGLWSGTGFCIDSLTCMDFQFKEARYDKLAQALQLKEQVREIVAISYSADGKCFAALVGRSWAEEPLDLVQGNVDGTGITTVPGLIAGIATQSGTLARIALSPDGKWLALTGKDGAAIAPVADPTPRIWTQVQASGTEPGWAPDSQHVQFAGVGVFDLAGKLVFNPGQFYGIVWQPDGKGGVIYGYEGMRLFRIVGGPAAEVKAPDWSVPAGFLPDGRLLVWLTVRPQQ